MMNFKAPFYIGFFITLVGCGRPASDNSKVLDSDEKSAFDISVNSEIKTKGEVAKLFFQVKNKTLKVFDKEPQKEAGICWLHIGATKDPIFEKGTVGKVDQTAYIFDTPDDNAKKPTEEELLRVVYVGVKFKSTGYSLLNCYVKGDSKTPFTDFKSSLEPIIGFNISSPLTDVLTDDDFIKIPTRSIEFKDLSTLPWAYISANSRYRTNLNTKVSVSQIDISWRKKEDIESFTKKLTEVSNFKISAGVHKVIFYKGIEDNAPHRSLHFAFSTDESLDTKWLECRSHAKKDFVALEFLKNCTNNLVKNAK